MGNLILGRGLAASAQVGNDVWIIGGRSYWGTVPQVERYSLDTYHTVIDSNWMMPPGLAVSNAGAAAIGSKIYVVGGATEDPAFTGSFVPVANLQIFDTTSLTWTSGTPLPQALMQCAVTSRNGKLYVFGGLVKGHRHQFLCRGSHRLRLRPGGQRLEYRSQFAQRHRLCRDRPHRFGKVLGHGRLQQFQPRPRSRDGSRNTIPPRTTWTQQLHLVRPRGGAAGINYGGQVYCLRGNKPSILSGGIYDEYADGEWYNLAWGYWMPSIMNYLGIWVSPPNVLDQEWPLHAFTRQVSG